jgi:hypothetical protein
MEFNFETFISPYREMLMRSGVSRYKNYEYVINKLVAKKKPLKIVETGTMWSGLEDNMGAFTLVFADLVKNWTGGSVTTIDISEKSLNNCKVTTRDYSDVINYVLSDSVTYLESLTDQEAADIDYLYLDSYDLFIPDPIPSQLHHYRELTAVYKRLSDDAIVSVDDNYLPNTWVTWDTFNEVGETIETTRYDIGSRIMGKGTLVDCFLLDQGWQRVDNFLHLDTVHMLTYER